MAKKPKVNILLKNVETFIKAVPIDPKAKNVKKWRKNRVEAARALKQAGHTLAGFEICQVPAVKIRCTTIPTKEATSAVVIPEPKPLPASVIICRKIPTVNIVGQIE